jgi:hypothetical protein
MLGNIFGVPKYRLLPLLQISSNELVAKMINMNRDKVIAALIHTV